MESPYLSKTKQPMGDSEGGIGGGIESLEPPHKRVLHSSRLLNYD